jgi:hypothetical protein
MSLPVNFPKDRNGIELKPGTKVAVFDTNRIAVGIITHYAESSICIKIGKNSHSASRFLNKNYYVHKVIALPDDFILDTVWRISSPEQNLEI